MFIYSERTESVSTFSIKSIAVSEFDLEMFWSKNVILSHNSLEGEGGRVGGCISPCVGQSLEVLKHDFK